MIISDNGTYTVMGEFLGFPTSDEGKWAFNSSKSHVAFTDNGGDISSYEIIKLKDKELKVKITTNGVEYIHEYVEK